MHIIPITAAKDIAAFVDLPYRLYAHDPNWVAPLRGEARATLNPRANATLQHCRWQLFLLRDGKRCVGRVAAFIDDLAVEAWGEKVGLFGHYEAPNHPAAAALLLNAARDWLRAQGCVAMRGPWSFVSQEWGAVVEGFTPPPVVMAPYNPAYYNDQFLAFGLEKVKDLLVYHIDASAGYAIPERILQFTGRIAEKYGVRIRPVNMRRYEEEIDILIRLSNQTLERNWGYAPVTDAEVRAMARDLKPVIHPQAVLFAEDARGQPIGFAIAIPDINRLLKGLNGRLFPVGWARLLWGLPRLRQYRMFALGVAPEYHGKGIDALMYRALYESIFTPELNLEINYILEDNAPMNNAVVKLGALPLRRYRVYQMPIE